MAAGLSKSMAYHVISGERGIGLPLAIWLYDQDGLKVGPLQGKTAREIAVLRQVHQPAAPDSVLARRAAKAA